MYHSIALLLPDATVLTGAGGAYGPVSNLNAEIYYPTYLYTSAGKPAVRPLIGAAPATAKVGTKMSVTINGNDKIAKVTMVRSGSVTHAFNPDQRFFNLTFTRQSSGMLLVSIPSDPDVAIPGSYLLFVFRGTTPSVARIVKITL